jgi:hypothetical protein
MSASTPKNAAKRIFEVFILIVVFFRWLITSLVKLRATQDKSSNAFADASWQIVHLILPASYMENERMLFVKLR